MVIVVTACALLQRYVGRNFVSRDASFYLIPWFEQISQMGLDSLGTQVGNYGIPYQTLIYIGTLFPFNPLHWYKLTSIVFDFVMAVSAGRLVFLLSKSRLKSVVAYSLTLLLPPFFLNSAVWGQCDSIYASFCLIALCLFFQDKIKWSFTAYGVALAFKLQAIFLLPFFLLAYVMRRRFSIVDFIFILIGFYVPSVPGILFGHSVLDPFLIYVTQSSYYPQMTANYPSFWCLVGDDYSILKWPAITLALSSIAIGYVCIVRSNRSLTRLDYLCVSAWTIWTCVEFLPAMHDRYDYLAVVLVLAILCIARNWTLVPPAAALLISDCLTYRSFLFGIQPDYILLSVLMLAAYLMFSILIFKKITVNRAQSS